MTDKEKLTEFLKDIGDAWVIGRRIGTRSSFRKCTDIKLVFDDFGKLIGMEVSE